MKNDQESTLSQFKRIIDEMNKNNQFNEMIELKHELMKLRARIIITLVGNKIKVKKKINNN